MANRKSRDNKIAALLINMGGPESLSAVRPFLCRLFSDRHVMDMPQPMRGLIARLISTFRTPKVRKRYEQIGGGSPLMKWTECQAQMTERLLKNHYPFVSVGVAYSYVDPSIDAAIARFKSEGHGRIVALPLYPHYSFSTLGGIFGELEKARMKYDLGERLVICAPFYKDTRYIEISASLAKNAIQKLDTAQPHRIVFTAHSLPVSFLLRGDPYQLQVKKNARLLACQAGIADYTLSFQSKVGPVEWIKPSTAETIREIGRVGIKQVAVIPIGFVCDNIETLHELDIELAEIAREVGIEHFVRGKVFNDSEPFARFLADYIIEANS